MSAFLKLTTGRLFQSDGATKMTSEIQLSICSKEDSRHHILMKTIDRLNQTKNRKVKFAGMDLGRTWKMKQERLSKRYTSRIDEIIQVRCNY